MPPLLSMGSGCDGPPKSVLGRRLASENGIMALLAHKSSPKNCISLSFASLVLLLKKARISVIPCTTLLTRDMDITVLPELYSITVFVLPGATDSDSRFNAGLVSTNFLY